MRKCLSDVILYSSFNVLVDIREKEILLNDIA